MKRSEERALYDAMRHATSPASGFVVEHEAERLGMPTKRAYYLLEKWTRKGWWDYGVSLRSGWFTPEAPETFP